jgi:polysaccharide biosynthesis/export protein
LAEGAVNDYRHNCEDVMKSFVYCMLLLVLLVVPAQAKDYVIGEGDGLDIAVWGVKDLAAQVKVRPDGKITMPGLGDVLASGLTPQELQTSLAIKLQELVKKPIVTVTVREITNSKIFIFGGGVKSGVYDLSRRTSLLQLLCTIGEIKVADLRRAYLLRGGKKIKENFHSLYIQGAIKDDVPLEPNDSLFIPLLQDKSVYVLGAVNAAKAIEYRDGMKVMEAILEAGGFTKFADQNNVMIRRKVSNQEEVITVKAKKLMFDGDLSQNVALVPGDYVVVKESLF